jgi:hypothetical protein
VFQQQITDNLKSDPWKRKYHDIFSSHAFSTVLQYCTSVHQWTSVAIQCRVSQSESGQSFMLSHPTVKSSSTAFFFRTPLPGLSVCRHFSFNAVLAKRDNGAGLVSIHYAVSIDRSMWLYSSSTTRNLSVSLLPETISDRKVNPNESIVRLYNSRREGSVPKVHMLVPNPPFFFKVWQKSPTATHCNRR